MYISHFYIIISYWPGMNFILRSRFQLQHHLNKYIHKLKHQITELKPQWPATSFFARKWFQEVKLRRNQIEVQLSVLWNWVFPCFPLEQATPKPIGSNLMRGHWNSLTVEIQSNMGRLKITLMTSSGRHSTNQDRANFLEATTREATRLRQV